MLHFCWSHYATLLLVTLLLDPTNTALLLVTLLLDPANAVLRLVTHIVVPLVPVVRPKHHAVLRCNVGTARLTLLPI